MGFSLNIFFLYNNKKCHDLLCHINEGKDVFLKISNKSNIINSQKKCKKKKTAILNGTRYEHHIVSYILKLLRSSLPVLSSG